MNEIIKPTGLDFTKDLHGHVRVETRSRWTGKVIDSQEKDNLVTNALKKLVYADAWINGNGLSTWFTPIYEKALGNLVLWGDTLTESADNLFFPNKPPLVIAPYGASADADAGSLNPSETILTSNGHTAVWDFSTSQANGTIAAISRAHYLLRSQGDFYISGAFSNGLNSGTYLYAYFIGYDETNKILYFAPASSTTIGGITFDTKGIYKVKKDFELIDLENSAMIFFRSSLVKLLSSSDGTTNASQWTYDRWANEFVYITGSTLHKLATDGTHTSSSLSGSGSSSYFTVTENYYWRVSGTTVYRISKTNLADVVSYTVQDTSYRLMPVGNDVVISGASESFGTRSYLYPDGTIIRKTGLSSGSFSNIQGKEIGMFYSQGQGTINGFYVRNNYLGTIANLDSPVTKTSSQTMKITYTLTEA